MQWPSTARSVHLVRHAEVHNPHHVVYGRLGGYGLSARGRRQANAMADRLMAAPVGSVLSSPLERARATADAVASRHGLAVVVEDDLTEWRLADRWEGLGWEELPAERPGELEEYLADPEHLPFSPESLTELARRWTEVVRRHEAAVPGDIVVVAHQDPVEAGRRLLTGRPFFDFHARKPGHAAVISLNPSTEPWTETGHWEPGPVD